MGNRAARNGVVKDYFDTVPILIRRGRMSRGFENIWRFLNADRTGGWGWAGTACRWQIGARWGPTTVKTPIIDFPQSNNHRFFFELLAKNNFLYISTAISI